MGIGSIFVRLGLAAAIAAFTTIWARAQPGDAARGRELAARLCIQCHVIARQASGAVPADVPSFPSMAGRIGVTAEFLAGRIIVPHPAMPGVPLTAVEIRDLVAYILSLK
jgi:mono/diheme cytochrome c family protein